MKKTLNLIVCGALIVAGLASCNSADNGAKSIRSVEKVVVESPEGTVPRLPYQLWVTYNDGTGAYRQVRWSNAALAVEKEQSDPALYPAGKKYTIEGHITGDNKTPKGYPVTAKITVTDDEYEVPGNVFKAQPLPLDKVVINGDNRLTSNRDMLIEQVLSWDITQQLYNYRDTYGLSTKGYTVSDGWDSPTTKLKGHGSGHYMSALAFAFASAVKPEHKDALRDRMRRMTDELRACQEMTFVWNEELGRWWEARDFAPEAELREMKGTWKAFDQHKKEWAKYGYGYINAIPAHHAVLIEMYRGYNNEQWVWAPYYSIHKQLAGLIDIATYVDDPAIAEKALTIATDMGLWIWNRLSHRTFVNTEGTQEERRAVPGNRYEMWNMYIAGEDGGTGESLARLAMLTDDEEKKARLLEASNFFDSPAFYDPLSINVDDIRTRHANQHIPKIISALKSYMGNNNPYYYNIALNFWNMVQGRYAYSTGGVGNVEMFRQPYTQILSMNTNVHSDRHGNLYPNPTLNETCCVYNLAKLTKDLNCLDPDDARYMDYYERVLYNQLVGSVDPHHYGVTYHYAVGLDASKPFGSETPQSTCCGGTGSENHTRYQEAAYFVNDNTMWVALYMPTTATWEAKGVKVTQDCLWPAEKSTITVEGTADFAMKFRVPYWATEGFDVKLNGKSVAKSYQPCSYVEIPARTWTSEDVVEVVMPFTKHINYGPDKMTVAATGMNETNTVFTPMWVGTLMYGPLAMSTDAVRSWDDALLNLDSKLECVQANAPTAETGTDGNIYTLTVGDMTFYPDYYLCEHSTRYLRINMDNALENATAAGIIDKSALEEGVILARSRKEAQEAWNAMEVKVPDHAPWAPHAYGRMVEQLAKAEEIMAGSEFTQEDVNNATALLNAAINTMRPGNLPELEDLNELLQLVKEAKDKNDPRKKEALEYAEMVIRYVSNGSGTMDMIIKGCEQLRK
ncbi:MAG: glycoside hydrolase family 127 protein [Bacteroidales bacterium]|nr:glycoside hydrolase family 127 protein [Bacteroidales bacterium]